MRKKKIEVHEIVITLFIYSVLIIGICMLISVAISKVSDINMRKNAVFTNGAIVDIKPKLLDNNGHSDSYTLVVKYMVKGQVYRNKIGIYNGELWLKNFIGDVGDTVTVYYNKDNPNKFKVENEIRLSTFSRFWIGVSFFVLGIIIVIKYNLMVGEIKKEGN